MGAHNTESKKELMGATYTKKTPCPREIRKETR